MLTAKSLVASIEEGLVHFHDIVYVNVEGIAKTPFRLVERLTFWNNILLIELFDSIELGFNLFRCIELLDGGTNNELHELASDHGVSRVGSLPFSCSVYSNKKSIGITILELS